MNIEHIFRLWKEYELALQKREIAVAAELIRLERLQSAGERTERECSLLQTQETALEKRMNEVISTPNDLSARDVVLVCIKREFTGTYSTELFFVHYQSAFVFSFM